MPQSVLKIRRKWDKGTIGRFYNTGEKHQRWKLEKMLKKRKQDKVEEGRTF